MAAAVYLAGCGSDGGVEPEDDGVEDEAGGDASGGDTSDGDDLSPDLPDAASDDSHDSDDAASMIDAGAGDDGSDDPIVIGDDAGLADAGSESGSDASMQEGSDGGAVQPPGELGTCTFQVDDGLEFNHNTADNNGETQPFAGWNDDASFGLTCSHNDGQYLYTVSLAASGITGRGSFQANMAGAAGIVQYSKQNIETAAIDFQRDPYGWK